MSSAVVGVSLYMTRTLSSCNLDGMPERIGDRFRFYRNQAGLTKEEAAEKIGVSLKNLTKIENGRWRDFTPDLITRASSAFGCDPAALLMPSE
jgi:transcriptional regulator with XRE-family HTH domain